MPLAPGTRIGPYEVLAAIGAGGVGDVYRARDRKLDRDVIIEGLADIVAAPNGQRVLIDHVDSPAEPTFECDRPLGSGGPTALMLHAGTASAGARNSRHLCISARYCRLRT